MKKLSDIRGRLRKFNLERIYRITALSIIGITAVLIFVILVTGGRYA